MEFPTLWHRRSTGNNWANEGSCVSFRYSGQVREFQVIDFTGGIVLDCGEKIENPRYN